MVAFVFETILQVFAISLFFVPRLNLRCWSLRLLSSQRLGNLSHLNCILLSWFHLNFFHYIALVDLTLCGWIWDDCIIFGRKILLYCEKKIRGQEATQLRICSVLLFYSECIFNVLNENVDYSESYSLKQHYNWERTEVCMKISV